MLSEVHYPEPIRSQKDNLLNNYHVFVSEMGDKNIPQTYTVCHDRSLCLTEVHLQSKDEMGIIAGVPEEALLLMVYDRVKAKLSQCPEQVSLKQAAEHIRVALEYLGNEEFQQCDR